MSDRNHPTADDFTQPPFPPHATSPDPSVASQTGAENLLNAAAVHTLPQKPVPNDDEQVKEKDVSKEGMPDDEKHRSDKSVEQQPLMIGTPLDEMRTPMFEKSGMALTQASGPQIPPGRESVQPATQQDGASTAASQDAHQPTGSTYVDGTGPERKSTDETIRRSATPTAPCQQRLDASSKRASDDARVNKKLEKVVQAQKAGSRPGFGAGHEVGSMRMGASALISALNAMPWEEDSDSSSSSDEEERRPRTTQALQAPQPTVPRPRPSRMHSSLHTIRPMSTPIEEDPVAVPHTGDASYFPANQPGEPGQQSMQFPFRQNTIARRARSPGIGELEYQFQRAAIRSSNNTDMAPVNEESIDSSRRSSAQSEESLAIGPEVQQVMSDQIAKEEEIGKAEEDAEIDRAEEELPELGAVVGARDSEENVGAALREGSGEEEVVEDRMQENAQEKKRRRREMLGERLMEVFGLEQREEVLEEMRCWLLRSVMLKGYMYLTPRHICFFAHMPDRDNLIVKTGPLSKKASRTKMNTKFWAVLKNDVLSWYESTADPYFPKGNISLQYASSCDPVDDTRFKLRTSERNYTFTADTMSARDEWIRAIQKVMFKTQHEGESVKLIIPLEAVLEVDRSPTLEFAETIEIKCVDPDDQMSVDSYFFASFQDGERAMSSIQRVLEERPVSDLPRVASDLSLRAEEDAVATQKAQEEHNNGPLGIKKIGSVLKPLISRTTEKGDDGDDTRSGFSIPFISKNKSSQPSHDSLETLRVESSPKAAHSTRDLPEDSWEGYPPRQAGAPPPGMNEESKGKWGSWIKKPSKIFGTSPSQSSLLSRSPTGHPIARTSTEGMTDSPISYKTRRGRGKRESVTEVVEPTVMEESSGDESTHGRQRRSSTKKPRLSFSSGMSEDDSAEQSDYAMMEKSESGHQEDIETANKFRSIFSLPEKEALIEHFPGYLYRVLPVSGRFFVSTSYLCFRSSQLLYKTKMIIPIRDLYGLKATKAFRFGHHGLIVVIKGHEELFLEFSSTKRRSACVKLLEERMEAVRLNNATDGRRESTDMEIQMRIMEDLDESTPVDPISAVPPVSPSPLFASTTSTFLEFKPEPMRITCLTIGSRGDVQPYIALCKGLQAEGHTTRIASHGEYKDWVEGHGIEFASVGGDPAELMQMCVDNGMFTVSFLKEGIQKFRGWLDDLLNSSWEACQNSDLLIESPSAMGGIHIAEALRIPYYRAFTMPWTRTRAYPHAFAVPEHKRGGSYNYMTYTMFDQVFWRAIAGQVNRFRRKVLNIEATNFDKLEQHKVPFLYNFSPTIVPPPLDWTEWIHVTGYWFLENADESAAKEKKWTPPQGLLDFIDKAHKDGKKVVYIGFGSIVVSDPQEMTRCVVDAVVDSGVCAILSKGWSDRGSKKDGDDEEKEDENKEDNEEDSKEGADGIKYPPEIFPIDSIDHTWLFPRIDAAVHHGGAGTSGASLRAGIPTIIKPFFGDQAFWSERVESLNVGSAIRKLTAEHLADALKQATTDEKQIAKAKVVGEIIRKENGVARAIEAIYRDLEYAKSLIKPPPEEKLEKTSSNSLFHVRSSSQSKPADSLENSRDGSDEHEHGHVSDSSWSVVSEDNPENSGKSRSLFSTPSKNRSASPTPSTGSGLLGKVKSVVMP